MIFYFFYMVSVSKNKALTDVQQWTKQYDLQGKTSTERRFSRSNHSKNTARRIINESDGHCLQDMPSHRIHPTDHAASSKHIQYKIRAYLHTADVQVI